MWPSARRGSGVSWEPAELLTPDDRKAITEVALHRAEPIRAMLGTDPGAGTRVIASGGTVRALARLAMGLHRPLASGSVSSIQVNQVEIPAGQLFELADRLATLDLDARLALPGRPDPAGATAARSERWCSPPWSRTSAFSAWW